MRVAGVLICTLAVIGCLALALAGVTAIVDGGYRPDSYAGRFDPVRAGLVLFAFMAGLVLALFAAIDIWRWRATADRWSMWLAVTMIGLAVVCASLAAFVVWVPASAGPLAVPNAIVVGFYLGGALAIAGLAPAMGAALLAAIDRRDRKVLVAGLLFAAAVVFSYAVRR